MNATADPSANFRLVIVQTELERFKFLVRSLLRARLAKVCPIIIDLLLLAKQRLADRRIPTSYPRSPSNLSDSSVATRKAVLGPPPTSIILTLQHCISLFIPRKLAEAGRYCRRNQYGRQARRRQCSLLSHIKGCRPGRGARRARSRNCGFEQRRCLGAEVERRQGGSGKGRY